MSGGDRNDPIPFQFTECRRILNSSTIARYMRRRYVVDSTNWDIPYLAGYSTGIVPIQIFIDRDMPDWNYKGREIWPGPFLTLHEQVEVACADAVRETEGAEQQEVLIYLRMTNPDDDLYFHCHGVATCAELHAVRMQFGDDGVADYNHFMRGQIKRAEDERIRRVPRVLDMLPYQGADKLDRNLRTIMEARMVA